MSHAELTQMARAKHRRFWFTDRAGAPPCVSFRSVRVQLVCPFFCKGLEMPGRIGPPCVVRVPFVSFCEVLEMPGRGGPPGVVQAPFVLLAAPRVYREQALSCCPFVKSW